MCLILFNKGVRHDPLSEHQSDVLHDCATVIEIIVAFCIDFKIFDIVSKLFIGYPTHNCSVDTS